MFIVGILSWWYGAGWKQRVVMLREQLAATLDYFSIGLLARTLFSPFRQISAEKIDGSLEARMRAFADRLISRCIGAIVRSVVIIVGIVTITLYVVIGTLTLIVWALTPLLPFGGIALFLFGWLPWTI